MGSFMTSKCLPYQQSATCQGLDLKFVLSRIVGEYIGVVFSYPFYDCLRQPCWEMDIARFPLFYCNCVNPFPNNLTCKETIASEVILEWEGDEGQRSKLYLPVFPFFHKKKGPLEWMAFCHGPSTLGSILFTQSTIQVCISFRKPWQSPPE